MLGNDQWRRLGFLISLLVGFHTGLQDEWSRYVVVCFNIDLLDVNVTVRRCVLLWLCGRFWPLCMIICGCSRLGWTRGVEVIVALRVVLAFQPEKTIFWAGTFLLVPQPRHPPPAQRTIRNTPHVFEHAPRPRPPQPSYPPPSHVLKRSRLRVRVNGVKTMDPQNPWCSPRGSAPRGIYVTTPLSIKS